MLLNMNSCQNFLAVIFFLCTLQAVSTNQFISVVLVGATGDLAKKYLWHSMFETYRNGIENKGTHFLFFGGARANRTFGEDTLMKIIDRSVTCYNMQCESHKRRFITVVRYVQLKVEEDYENLSHQMALDEESHSPDNPIAGRIFYLSTPPATYVKTAQLLHKHCRSHVANSWIRLVLEKPFGNDRKTSEALASSLEQWYSEEEIYRVDHYLQKPVVKQILPFRIKNQNWLEPLLNRHHVERVEIVSKEYIGVKDEIIPYNMIVLDVNPNEDSPTQMCPPRPFLESDNLKHMKRLLSPKGVLVINTLLFNELIRKEALNQIKTEFQSIYQTNIEVEVNVILYVFAETTNIQTTDSRIPAELVKRLRLVDKCTTLNSTDLTESLKHLSIS